MDNKLALEEARRAAQYNDAKLQVENDVSSEIAARADVPTRSELAQTDQIARDMRGKAVGEIADTSREVERGRTMARISQIVDYAFYLIYALFAIRLVLALVAARSNNGFVQFINAVTNPLYAPFRGITNSPATAEGYTLALPIIIALIAYALLHLAINGLLRLVAQRKTEI
ncbi:MAG: YggT family protein [Pyrinomonadaceae bacterium]|nr:YggT family protein [Pyrinomonadaceae bacterium]